MHLQENTFLQGGKYRIVRFINSGGFGCTYEAEHVMLGERVAIKEFFVKDFCNRDESTSYVTIGTQSKHGLVNKLKQKFVEEAKMLYRMQHPNIVRVFDIFEENNTAYFVMDYIEGPSLGEIVTNEGKLNEKRAIKYIRQVADALKFVHNQDRLHLDIKPSNIMVNEKDQAILIDFGASKQYDEQDGENTSTLLGKTPGYAPLEQMGNDVVKFMPATDIYAIGATLYKLLTGITPLSANLIASGEVLEPLPNYISDTTRKTIDQAMQINKNRRIQSVAEFLTMLDGVVIESQSSQQVVQQSEFKHNEQILTNEEITLLVTEPKSEFKNIEKGESLCQSTNDRSFKSWKEYFKERHLLVNLIMVTMFVISLVMTIVLTPFSINEISDYFHPEVIDVDGQKVVIAPTLDSFWTVVYMLPVSLVFLIGLIPLFKHKQSGFWFIVMSIPIVNILQPLSVIMTYEEYSRFSCQLFYYCFIWVVVPIISLFVFYGILQIKFNGKSAWSLMDVSPAWMKIASWFTWLFFGIAMFAVLP